MFIHSRYSKTFAMLRILAQNCGMKATFPWYCVIGHGYWRELYKRSWEDESQWFIQDVGGAKIWALSWRSSVFTDTRNFSRLTWRSSSSGYLGRGLIPWGGPMGPTKIASRPACRSNHEPSVPKANKDLGTYMYHYETHFPKLFEEPVWSLGVRGNNFQRGTRPAGTNLVTGLGYFKVERRELVCDGTA